MVAETQVNWEFINRWTAIGFIGTGKAFGQDALGNDSSFSSSKYRTAGEAGFRYSKKVQDKSGSRLRRWT